MNEIGKSGTMGSAVAVHLTRTSTVGPERMDALTSLRRHWPEYLMEAGELGAFMFSACAVATLLQHPASPLRQFIGSGLWQRVLTGVAMGAAAVAIIMSPWGKQSGAHFNPAVTLTFLRLGKVMRWDAVFYIVSQFAGGVAGVAVASVLLRGAPAHEAIRYAMTVPGPHGNAVAFAAELVISFGLMTTVLVASNADALARYTPYFVAALVATYITFESPLSGMSMNPARTFGSALNAAYFKALWIYFTAPPLAMLAAAEVFLRIRGGVQPRCAKLHHANDKRCIFRCGYMPAQTQTD